jgi:phospholipid-translocating ATPase
VTDKLVLARSFLNLFLLALMTIMCAVVDHFLEKAQYPQGAYWLYGDNQSGDNPSINGLITWANALIAFQVRSPTRNVRRLDVSHC